MLDRNNLEIWYFVSQIFSPLVAIVALLLLANQTRLLSRQIRESNRYQKTSQYQAAMLLMFDWRSDLIRDPKLAERLSDPKNGSQYFREVLDQHGVESYFHTMKMFSIFEVFFILHREGIIDEPMWKGWQKNFGILLTPKRHREIWSQIKALHTLNPEFEKLIDQIIEQKNQHVAEQA